MTNQEFIKALSSLEVNQICARYVDAEPVQLGHALVYPDYCNDWVLAGPILATLVNERAMNLAYKRREYLLAHGAHTVASHAYLPRAITGAVAWLAMDEMTPAQKPRPSTESLEDTQARWRDYLDTRPVVVAAEPSSLPQEA